MFIFSGGCSKLKYFWEQLTLTLTVTRHAKNGVTVAQNKYMSEKATKIMKLRTKGKFQPFVQDRILTRLVRKETTLQNFLKVLHLALERRGTALSTVAIDYVTNKGCVISYVTALGWQINLVV